MWKTTFMHMWGNHSLVVLCSSRFDWRWIRWKWKHKLWNCKTQIIKNKHHSKQITMDSVLYILIITQYYWTGCYWYKYSTVMLTCLLSTGCFHNKPWCGVCANVWCPGHWAQRNWPRGGWYMYHQPCESWSVKWHSATYHHITEIPLVCCKTCRLKR